MLDEIFRLINEIHFIWISNHLRIKGNERADCLAQSAIKNGGLVEIKY